MILLNHLCPIYITCPIILEHEITTINITSCQELRIQAYLYKPQVSPL